MRAIPTLNVDAEDIFDAISSAKRPPRREQMRSARGSVFAAYGLYDRAVPNVGGLGQTALTGDQREAMHHAYEVETVPMAALRGDLLGRIEVFRCPFCGLSETSTLDHYLPKEKYPEFSVFPSNLVPACGVCNTRKKDRILVHGTDVQMFLHPCYDQIPDLPFLDVRAALRGAGLVLSYALTQPAGMSDRTFQHLNSHFKELKLADRYRKDSLVHLGDQYPAFRRAYGPDGNAQRVVGKLIESAEDKEEVHGLNHWLAKLYRALAADARFCNGGFQVIRVIK